MSTLTFSFQDCFHIELFKEYDDYVRDVGDPVAASRYFDYVLFYMASEALTSVWCNSGPGFVSAAQVAVSRALVQANRQISDGFLSDVIGLSAALRYNFDTVKWDRLLIRYPYLFTARTQWYELEIARTGLSLEQLLPGLTMRITSPHQDNRVCTFSPWALYTGTGVAGFNNI